VGSGFCPILSQRERRDGARWAPPFGGGRPRAMLAPDASVGKAEKNSDIAVCGKISALAMTVSEGYFADSLLFDSCITDFEWCDSVTGDSCIFISLHSVRSSSPLPLPFVHLNTARPSDRRSISFECGRKDIRIHHR